MGSFLDRLARYEAASPQEKARQACISLTADYRLLYVGAGWRLYFTQRGTEIIVLLVGGSKRTQKKDIKRAKALAALLD